MSVLVVTMGATEMHIVQITRCGNVVGPMMLSHCVRCMALCRWCECERGCNFFALHARFVP